MGTRLARIPLYYGLISTVMLDLAAAAFFLVARFRSRPGDAPR